jgi:hypothetical protein
MESDLLDTEAQLNDLRERVKARLAANRPVASAAPPVDELPATETAREPATEPTIEPILPQAEPLPRVYITAAGPVIAPASARVSPVAEPPAVELVDAPTLPIEPEPVIEPPVAAAVIELPPVPIVPDVVLAPAPVVAPVEDPPTLAMPALTPAVRAPTAPVRSSSLFIPPAEVSTDFKKAKQRAKQKSGRHRIRSFFVFVLVLAILAGGAYVGWYKFLRKAAVWPDELKASAAFVEDHLHRDFDATVPVVSLAGPDYTGRLTTLALSGLYSDPSVAADPAGAAKASGVPVANSVTSIALRAIGLGAIDPAAVGPTLAAVVTSFYSESDRTIYRQEGTTAVYQADMLRAMTAALIDQALDYSPKLREMTDAQRTGMRALVADIANSVVAARAAASSDFEESLRFEQRGRIAKLEPIPVALQSFVAAHLFDSDRPFAGTVDALADEPLVGLAIPSSDAAVFDPARVDLTADTSAAPTTTAGATATTAAATTAPPASEAPSTEPPTTVAPAVAPPQTGGRTMGMEFWFDMLVPSIGPDAARAAALTWTGDMTAASTTIGQACLGSTISTESAESQQALLGVLISWAAAQPATSLAQVAAAGSQQVTVSVCEPADGDPTAAGPTVAVSPDFVLADQAAIERLVLKRATSLGLPSTLPARECMVVAYRTGSIPSLTPDTNQTELVDQMTNVVTFCS